MSEHEQVPVPDGNQALVTVLTPGATAISAFAFAVFSMMGQGTWTQTMQALWGPNFAQNQVGHVLASWALTTLLLAGVAFLLARRTLRSASTAAGWEGQLARAAIIVAAAGALLSALGILAGLVRGV